MNIVAIVGSPRKNGNTEQLASYTLKSIAEEGMDTEIISLAGKEIKPCNACMSCKETGQCSIEDDLPPIYQKMKTADGIILASPVYYGSCTALLKALMERTGHTSRFDGNPFQGKVGGPLVVARRAGQNFTVSQINFWFYILGMVVPGSTYWNIAFGREKDEVMQDEEALKTAWNFGKNLALVLKKLHS
ncbi:MAG: Iron-sulfur flavoprotein [Chloroflexi bacterium]|nr:Iron-sulfur flavoprotein [Chloroflexota bacterium]